MLIVKLQELQCLCKMLSTTCLVFPRAYCGDLFRHANTLRCMTCK